MVSLRYEIDNESPEEKKRFIRAMFSSIVPAYDRLKIGRASCRERV